MAKQISFSAPDGTDHPNSYWRIVQVNLNLVERTGYIEFHGYRNVAARAAGRTPVGTKTYMIRPSDFDLFFVPAELAKKTDVYAAAYGYATTASTFFDGAQDV